MKLWRVVLVLVVLLGLFQILVSFRQQNNTPALVVREKLCRQLDSLSDYLKDTLLPLAGNNAPETQLQQAFLKTRRYYKTVEWAAEYFTYSTAKMINGPPKPEIEIASRSINNPNGLQVMEAFLFPHYTISRKAALQQETQLLIENVAVLKTYFSHIDIASWQILDAAKLEVFRIETIGITGFDNPLTLQSMQENAAALHSVQEVLQLHSNDEKLHSLFFNTIDYLYKNIDFNAFDRAFFIRHYINPLSRAVEEIRRQYATTELKYNRLLRQDAMTLFDSGVFNTMAYSPFLEQKNTREKIALGKWLFNSPAFSGTQTRSCASCHIEAQVFANNLIKEKTIDGTGVIDRNTPTLINTALQPQQFYDQRAENIEAQILDVVHNPKEMKGSIRQAIQRLQSNPGYKRLIADAYPGKNATNEDDIVESLATYVRSLTKLNSRFDDYMRGDDRAMNSEEISGFNLFMGKAQCATCHYMPLFSGVFPPKYISQDAEVLGVSDAPKSKVLDPDRGMYGILSQQGFYDSSLMSQFDHAFKTVSVRNTTKTAPYMHNGVFATLKDVVEFYNDGGGAGRGVYVPNQTLGTDSLHLTPKEVDALVAFMGTLDSR
ncbi:MAG: cytochrome c peroxidase [Chitinophagaceae bacterium]